MILAAWYHTILAMIFSLFAVLLMGVILLQRGKGVGLAGAFGGAGGHSAFGSKTGDVLTWATVVIAIMFLCVAVLLNYVFVPERATPPAMIVPGAGEGAVSVEIPQRPQAPVDRSPPQTPATQSPATETPAGTPSGDAPAQPEPGTPTADPQSDPETPATDTPAEPANEPDPANTPPE